MSSDLDLDSVYTFAIQLGKDAGQLLQDAAQRRMNGEDQLEEVEKLNSVDIVTKTDEGKICPNFASPYSISQYYRSLLINYCIRGRSIHSRIRSRKIPISQVRWLSVNDILLG
jgi:hypothetical protein